MLVFVFMNSYILYFEYRARNFYSETFASITAIEIKIYFPMHQNSTSAFNAYFALQKFDQREITVLIYNNFIAYIFCIVFLNFYFASFFA